MKWKVFLPDRSREAVETKIHELAHELVVANVNESGLMGGAAGVACFFAYYADWTGNLHFKGLAEELVEQTLNPPASRFPGYSFSNGYAGIAWAIRHLKDASLIDPDAEPVFGRLNNPLADHMAMEIRNGHYDYLHGALGIALYFLQRPADLHYHKILVQLLDEIERLAIEEEGGGLKWLSVLDPVTKLNGYNLSLSHGSASIMIILSKLVEAGISIDKCRELINGSYKYLRKQKLKGGKHLSYYPSWALESTVDPANSRMAWCYGDIGIALACMAAGKAIGDRSILQHGEELLMRSSMRKDLTENRVMDAGLCHGTAGLALIFNFECQRTGKTEFKEAASYWLTECLKMDDHTDGIAGYKALYHQQYGGWVKVPGLLEGAAGIGLTLMTFVNQRYPGWGKALLLQ